MTESAIKINGFPPIIWANLAVARGDTPGRKPLIAKDGMILSESWLCFDCEGKPGPLDVIANRGFGASCQ